MTLKIRFLEHRELLSKIKNIPPTKYSELVTGKISETVKILLQKGAK